MVLPACAEQVFFSLKMFPCGGRMPSLLSEERMKRTETIAVAVHGGCGCSCSKQAVAGGYSGVKVSSAFYPHGMQSYFQTAQFCISVYCTVSYKLQIPIIQIVDGECKEGLRIFLSYWTFCEDLAA